MWTEIAVAGVAFTAGVCAALIGFAFWVQRGNPWR